MKNKSELLKIVVGLLIIVAVAFGVLSKGKNGSSTTNTSGSATSSESGETSTTNIKESESEKKKSSAEFVNDEKYLCDVCLGFKFDENLFFNKGDKEAHILLDGKEVATVDKEDSVYVRAFMNEGKHKITIKTGWLGDSSVEFTTERRGDNCFGYDLKDKGKKVVIEESESLRFSSDYRDDVLVGNYKLIKNDLDYTYSDAYTGDGGYWQLGNLQLTFQYYPITEEEIDNGFYGKAYADYRDYTGDIYFWYDDSELSNCDTEDKLKELMQNGILDDKYDEIQDLTAFSVGEYPAVSCKYILNWDTDVDAQDYLDDICGKRSSTVHAAAVYCNGAVYFLTMDLTFLSDELQDIVFQEVIDSFTYIEDDEDETEVQNTEESTDAAMMGNSVEGSAEMTMEPESIEETTASFDAGQAFIFPDSDSAYISESQLSGLSQDELRYAVNEIYARHHRRFKDAQLQAYFDAKSWYSGTVEPENFDEQTLNAYEKENVKVIRAYIEKTK